MGPEGDLDDCLLPEMFAKHLLEDVQLLPQDRRQSCGVAFEQEEESVNITELFHSLLNFSGVEAGSIVGVLKAGGVDNGNAVICWVS